MLFFHRNKGRQFFLDKRWVNFTVCSVCGHTWKTALPGKQWQLVFGCCGGLHCWGKQLQQMEEAVLNWAGFDNQYKWCSQNVPYQTSDLFYSLNNLCFHPQEETVSWVFLYMGHFKKNKTHKNAPHSEIWHPDFGWIVSNFFTGKFLSSGWMQLIIHLLISQTGHCIVFFRLQVWSHKSHKSSFRSRWLF